MIYIKNVNSRGKDHRTTKCPIRNSSICVRYAVKRVTTSTYKKMHFCNKEFIDSKLIFCVRLSVVPCIIHYRRAHIYKYWYKLCTHPFLFATFSFPHSSLLSFHDGAKNVIQSSKSILSDFCYHGVHCKLIDSKIYLDNVFASSVIVQIPVVYKITKVIIRKAVYRMKLKGDPETRKLAYPR